MGVRNHLLVLSLAGLTGPTARRIGAAVAGAVTVTMPYGAGLIGTDRAVYRLALKALPAHPNVGATLLLGDNPPLMAEIATAAESTGKPFAAFTMDDCQQDAITMTERGLRAAARMAQAISAARRVDRVARRRAPAGTPRAQSRRCPGNRQRGANARGNGCQRRHRPYGQQS